MDQKHEEWMRIERTSAFKQLVKSKKAFIVPATIFFMVFYFGLPVLAAFTTLLNFTVVGSITGAYAYAFAQFAMTWILMHVYVSQANKWDRTIEQVLREASEEGASS